MKKIPFLFLICFLISSLFCGGLCLVPAQVSADNVSPLADAVDKHFEDAETFVLYVNSYSSTNANDNIILDANLDMTGFVLTNTIGTQDAPFRGTFNGNGYVISNLEINQDGSGVDVENARRVYAGLFGYVKGSSSNDVIIQNVGFSGNLKITVQNYSAGAYVGTLAGWAENAKIQYVQMTADVTLSADFSKNLVFGGIVGNLSNGCDVRAVICRPVSLGFWRLTQKDDCILKFGGLFGHCEGSFVTFAVVDVPFDLTISQDFGGEVMLGGVAGTLDQMHIDNVAIDNEYALDDSSNSLVVGEVVGKVVGSDDGSLCYIYFKQHSGISIFGSLGSFNFVQQNDHIEQSLQDLNALIPSGTGYSYFEEKHWHPFRDKWDFQREFYVGSSKILLQSFYGDFRVAFQNQNPSVITCTLENNKSYRYGQSATMTFIFNTSEGTNMIDYYDIKALSLGGSQVASIITEENADGTYTYSFSGLEDRFAISSANNGFSITVLSINNSLAGNYSLTIQPKDFTINLSSRLFKTRETNDFEFEGDGEDTPVLPGNVFEYNQDGTKNLKEHLTGLTYNKSYTLDTDRKSGTFYTHFGWCILYEDGTMKSLDASETTGSFTFTFGKGDFTKQALLGEGGQSKISAIVAKYIDDACKVTFLLGDGIERVELYSGRTVIDDVQTLVPISKTADITMSIFIRDGFQFDTEKFIEDLSIYAGGSNESGFCILEQEVKNTDETYYVFRLDMKKLMENFQSELTIDVKADEIQVDHLVWLWWTLGVLGGLIIIGLVIFLIVFLVKRRGGGGSSRGYKAPTKKSYKGMYY